MASGGKSYYAAQAAASSSSGSDPAPGWKAAVSLLMIAAQRARQWREAEGLLDDNDFAYAYTDYDQVVGLAGHHVADDWLQTRARVEEELLAAGAKVVEDNPKGSVVRTRTSARQCRRGPTASYPCSLGWAPTGLQASSPMLTDAFKAEWKQTCQRIAEKKLQDAEKATIDRVINTWLELRSFLESWGRPAPPEMVDLDQYLNHTQAPARALQALKWMNKNANQELDLTALWNCMRLEMRSGQSSWPHGHGSWRIVVRYAHIARSEPRRLTAAFLHCRCPKGKQKHAREGFDFAVPACFSNGFFWAKEVLEAHRALAPARQRVAGLCFSDEGRPWTILEVQETMQSEMAVLLDNPEEITTYSWRRSAAQRRWLHWGIGRTKVISPKLVRWPSTTPQQSMQPPSRSSL